jgi:hypothetical protein
MVVLSERMSVMGRVVARAFWGPRPQSIDDGLAAFVATLRGLGELDERFGRWFDLGKSMKDALRREIAVDPDAIRPFLKRNQENGRVFEELGWSFSAWNGAARDEDSLDFRSHFSVTSQWVKNSVVFKLPPEWEQDLGRARRALDIVVRTWRPEQANVWNADRVELLKAEL